MTSPRPIVLNDPDDRDFACGQVRVAPKGWVVNIGPRKRTLPQNRHIHKLCRKLAESEVEWAGKRRTLGEWKNLLASGHAVATGRPLELMLGIEGERLMLRDSTAEMPVSELSSLLEYTIAFCAMRGIQLKDDHAG